MYKYILENAGDLSVMALIPLVLFFAIFIGVAVWTIRRSGGYIERMSQLPFEDSLSENPETK